MLSIEKLFESDLHSGFYATSEEDSSINNFSIVRLSSIKILESIQDRIVRATGPAFVTVGYRGEPITEMTSFTLFRQQARKDENAKRICMSSSAFGMIQATVTQKTYVYFCPCGLVEIVIPIVVWGHYLRDFIGGQARCGDAPADICWLENTLYHDRNHRKDPKMNRLLESVIVYPYEKFLHITNLVSLTVNQPAEKRLFHLVQKENLGKELKVLNGQRKKMETELAALKTQMNPHFLSKSLGAISNLSVVEDTPRTNRTISLFTEFMRFGFSETGDNVFASDEVENLKRCLKIQKERMGDQLQYVLGISDELNVQKIPSRTLLPFAEKAVFYGVGQKRGYGTLWIAAQYQGDGVVPQMEDDGPGFSDRKIAQLLKQYKGSYEGGAIEASIAFSRRGLVNSFDIKYDVVIKNVDGVRTISTIRYPKNFNEKANWSCIRY